jgi:hypothetical protein
LPREGLILSLLLRQLLLWITYGDGLGDRVKEEKMYRLSIGGY